MLVAGIGNLFRSDDGFGPEVVRRLGDQVREDVRVVDYGIRGMHLAYDLLDGYDALVIVDAVATGEEAGDLSVTLVGPQDVGDGEFDAHGIDLPLYWGNRNWHPLIADTVQQMAADGVRRAAVFATSATGSYSGCRQYRDDLAGALAELGDSGVQLVKLRHFYDHPRYVAAHVQARSDGLASQDELRTRSAGVVTPSDVDEVDDALIAFVQVNRGRSDVLIDSHPVTKEEYGYRITPFSFARFADLAPDEIWVLYASPEETQRRIAEDSGGRPMVTVEEAGTHTALQSAVAATYGMAIGRPVYLFDTSADRDRLVDRLAARLA